MEAQTELAPTEFAPGAVVSVWFDGWRMAVVVEVGRKWAKLLEVGTLVQHKVPLTREEPLSPNPILRTKQLATLPTVLTEALAMTTSPVRVADTIRRTRATFKRCGVGFRAGPVKTALVVLHQSQEGIEK